MLFKKNNMYSIKNVLVFVLFAILLSISLWRLSYSPATWYDEGINAGIARSLIQDNVFSLKIAPGEYVETRQFLITTNYPVLLPVALSLKFFGVSFTAARLPLVVYLCLFALVAYIATRKWYGDNAALATLALIVFFLPFYGNGKSVLGEVAGLFFLLAGLLFLENHNLKKIFLAGLFLGLSVATKPFFLLVLPALFVGEVYRFFVKEKRKLPEYFILGLGLSGPILIWFLTINPNFNFSNILTAFQYYSNSYADKTNIFELIFSNLKRFFTETTPLHFFVMFVVSAVMIVRGLYKKSINVSEMILFVFVILNFLWYLKTPGWYRYFFPAHLLLFLFFPAGLNKILSKRFFIIIILFFLAIQSFLLVSKHNEPLYYSTEVQDFVEYTYQQMEVNDSILVVNSPSVAFLLVNRSVSQYVRINPQLVFAPNNILKNQEFIDQKYIAVGTLNNEDVDVKKILDEKYERINSIGHYTLYKFK